MVDTQIRSRGVRDPRVLAAMARVPRHAFVPPSAAALAYRDTPLPVAEGQTISQPYMVAATLEAARVEPTDRVLDVGTGTGYAAAVASQLAAEVISVEWFPALAETAAATLARLGYRNVRVLVADGSLGMPDHAPYDAIVAAAAAPRVPAAWKEQLGEGGRIVAPVDSFVGQRLVRMVRSGDRFPQEGLMGVRYVPLLGEQGHGGRPQDR